ncbi:MAG: hypothetical protein WB493_04840 [Anaeromyxobacteraceae bacterium]
MDTSPAHRSALSLLVLFAFASGGCGDLPEPKACDTSAPCPAGAWCRSGQCVANAPPIAVIDAPATPGTNRPLLLRGGASRDDDPGDAVSSWSWKISPPPGTTACEPLPGQGSGPDITVVFPCPGDHEVSLTVTDTQGLASPPRTVHLGVAPTLDPPLLSAGPDVVVGHRCAGAPLACTPWDGVSGDVLLTAAGEVPAGVSFTYRWSVETPAELGAQPAPRITFTPSESAAEPRVRIETPGSAISGRYTFVVQLTDSRGMVAVARQRIDVTNRPPLLSGGGAVLLPHGYEPGTRRFVASGETAPAAWSDPDGDPVASLGFTSVHAGDGGAVFDVQDQGDRARLTVVVPYEKPADASRLIGPSVSRRVDLAVADVNGARAATSWEVTVANRAPRLAVAVPAASVDHTFESAAARYAAQAALSTWVDDDGDPISLAVTGDGRCADLSERQGTAWVTCSAPFTGKPDPGVLVGTRVLAASARDPFEAGPVQETRLEIRNRPPRLVGTQITLAMTCNPDRTCCTTDPGKGSCAEYDFTWVETSAVAPVAVDDDGDPIDVAVSAAGGCLTAAPVAGACTGAACSPLLTLCGNRWTCGEFLPGGSLAVSVGDGLVSASGAFLVDAVCRP